MLLLWQAVKMTPLANLEGIRTLVLLALETNLLFFLFPDDRGAAMSGSSAGRQKARAPRTGRSHPALYFLGTILFPLQ